MVSITIEYNTTEIVLAPDIFSCARRNSATADPPMLVGDTAEANSQMTISCMDLPQVNSSEVMTRSLHA